MTTGIEPSLPVRDWNAAERHGRQHGHEPQQHWEPALTSSPHRAETPLTSPAVLNTQQRRDQHKSRKRELRYPREEISGGREGCWRLRRCRRRACRARGDAARKAYQYAGQLPSSAARCGVAWRGVLRALLPLRSWLSMQRGWGVQ